AIDGKASVVTVVERDSARLGMTGTLQSLAGRRTVRQFAKFCIVGAGSTVIDFGVFALLDRVAHLPDHLLALLAGHPAWHALAERIHAGIRRAAALSFTLAVTNGYYGNRRWTFSGGAGANGSRQYAQFVLVNVIGLLLNLAIIAVAVHLFASLVGK